MLSLCHWWNKIQAVRWMILYHFKTVVMGVRGLWSVLEPVEEHIPLRQLRGLTLAIDLAIWVCGDQLTEERLEKTIQQNTQSLPCPLHLRNLFYRVRRLLLLGVQLVVVVDGKAPEIKLFSMRQRQKESNSRSPDRLRRSFRTVLEQCRSLLEAMGVAWLQSPGEAESMCALINRLGLVDGCITNDGDAFLYGASVVYRNFTMSAKDPHVQRYRASRVTDELHLTRWVSMDLRCVHLRSLYTCISDEATMSRWRLTE